MKMGTLVLLRTNKKNRCEVRWRRFGTLFFLFLWGAQVLALSEYSFNFKNYNDKDGLSQNTVTTIVQDENGFIWLGTLNGLNRFDGNGFKAWLPKHGKETMLSDCRVRTIRNDGYGYLWIQSNIDNVNCYNTQMGRFIDFYPPHKSYANVWFASTGDVWFWGPRSGCLQIIHTGTSLKTVYRGEGSLGTTQVNFVQETHDSVIWIGTDNGLLNYRNNQLTWKRNVKGLKFAVEVGTCLYVITDGGKVLVYDLRAGKFVKEKVCWEQGVSPSINDAAMLSQQRILLTTAGGIFILKTKTLEVVRAEDLFNGERIKGARTYYDNKGHLWIYNNSGSLWQYQADKLWFKNYKLIPPNILSRIDLERYCIYHDSRDIIWISTYGNGLFAIDENTGEIEHIKSQERNNAGLRTNFLLSVFEDNTGEVWVGTEYAGVSKISVSKYKNNLWVPEGEAAEANDRIIRLIQEDRNGNIWLGTKGGNLFICDKDYNLLKKHHIEGGVPYAFEEDAKGNIWIGTKGNGLLFFKKGNYLKYRQFSLPGANINSQISNNIYTICQDNQGRMWLGAFGNGLLLASETNGTVSFQKIEPLSLQQNRVRIILQDRYGMIWAGGNNGVVTFYPEKLLEEPTKFQAYHFEMNDARTLSSNEVKIIFEDRSGRVWLGTSGGGLNLAVRDENDPGKIEFEHFTTEEGLINNVVQGIQEDAQGALWISTESGVSKLDAKSLRFENYNLSDNWQGNLFCESAACRLKSGEILLGSYNGMYILRPETMIEEVKVPSVIFTDLEINGNKIEPLAEESPLKKAVYGTSGIKLKYGQNSFNIQFATLHYRNPEANSYSYILEGYEQTWNPVTRHNVATYRNVPPGKYTFKVKGCNSLGVWNNVPATLQITIVPPLWRSPWFILGYTILFIAGVVVAITLSIKINKLNMAVKVEQQLTEFKLRFFTNISHEFRSPLTLIRGTVEELLSKTNGNGENGKQLRLLEKSSKRLLRLTNQLLVFRQLQNDKLRLKPEEAEAVSFFKEIFTTFEELATKRQIQYRFLTNKQEQRMLLDLGNMEKVVHNLLSNAFKFTPEEGKIELSLDFIDAYHMLSIRVSDSGSGIPEDKIDQLFERFSQIDPKSTGMGIGLHLASELVKLHKGNMAYKTSSFGGACFEVKIPFAVSDQSTAGAENIQHTSPGKKPDFELLHLQESSFLDNISPQYKSRYDLLVVEDDEEIREYLLIQLGKYFNVMGASNGKAGLEMSIEKQPGLIVCDVMMPEMDGYEVTRRVRSEFKTSHIPIILLTAYASDNHQIQGIESGADAYITKPFSTKYLITRIVKLIEQREKLRQKFAKAPGLEQIPTFTVDKDNVFIKKVQAIVEHNIENGNFVVEDFLSSLKMGRTVFFKKIKGLTGYTPNEYIRVMRMKKAAELLATTSLNVSEVAYKVGMNNPFYFSSCFKKQFGTTPSAFAKNGRPTDRHKL